MMSHAINYSFSFFALSDFVGIFSDNNAIRLCRQAFNTQTSNEDAAITKMLSVSFVTAACAKFSYAAST